MANVAIFKTNETPRYLSSVNTQDYESDTDALINPSIASVQAVPLKYWKRVANAIQEMNAGEKATVDAAEAAAIVTANRVVADALKDLGNSDGVKWRAITLMLLDEFNSVRGWLASFKIEVAAATNLADLKTRVATLPNMPNRTLAQTKTAYTNKINAGSAD